MNKKAYIKPSVEVINIDSVQMICASNQFDITDTTTNNNADLANGRRPGRRGQWGNLWSDDKEK